jgi:hypothetical protein
MEINLQILALMKMVLDEYPKQIPRQMANANELANL